MWAKAANSSSRNSRVVLTLLMIVAAFCWPCTPSRGETSGSRMSATSPHVEVPSQASIDEGASGYAPAGTDESREEVFSKVLLILILVLGLAKVGGDVFERLGQPAVLGELLFGIL